MKIVAISGSLRQASFNTALLVAARDLAPDGMAIDLTDIAAIPLYNADEQARGFPGPVQDLADAIRAADGVLFATPEYNHSIPGVLKNAIDWVSRVEDQPFSGKAAAIMGASPGLLGTARAQPHLRQILIGLNAYVLNRPEVFVGGARSKFDVDGKLVDEDTRRFLADFLRIVKDWVEKVGRTRD